jgi:hypothetical protein
LSETRTFLIVTRQGSFTMTIPEEWKITCGRPQGNQQRFGDYELRLYETKEKQRACFTDVLAFRDLSIEITRVETRRDDEPDMEAESVYS